MRKLIVAEFMSLDGVMQAPGGPEEDTDGGFAHGGWTLPYWHDDIGARFMEAMAECDAFLLGRRTWEGHSVFETFEEGDPFGDMMKAMPKYVVSTTLESADAWRNSTIIRDNVIEEVRRLKEQQGKSIYIDGSSVLVHTLAEHSLIDEYSLLVYPLLLGSGKRVFAPGSRVDLSLEETRTFPTGVVLMRYAVNHDA
ncbi:MAG: dihydrofolate reductase family protein [Dehalococcoidia bacterium]